MTREKRSPWRIPFFYLALAFLISSQTAALLAMSLSVAGPLFALNVKVALKADRRDEFLRIIQRDAKQTIGTEPGALQFALGVDTTNPNVLHFHEQYKSQCDFDHHCATPHFQEWKDFCDTQPFTADPVVHIFQCQHEPVKIEQRPAFCLNVEICVKEEMRQEFLTVIDNNQRGSRSSSLEPLCLQYDFGESTDTPNTFYFHEEYTGEREGKEGFDAHAASPHFQKWEEFAAKNPFTKEPVVSFFKSIVVSDQ